MKKMKPLKLSQKFFHLQLIGIKGAVDILRRPMSRELYKF